MNNLEFDQYLINNLPQLPPEDIVTDVTPTKQAMDRVIAGVALSTITFRFLCLDYILPAIGLITLVLGFRALKNENQWFRRGYIVTLIRMGYFYIILVLNATIYQENLQNGAFVNLLLAANLIIVLYTIICLWQGIKEVQEKAGITPNAGSAGALILWYLIICICGIIKINSILIVGVLLISYFFILRSLGQLSKELDETGYLVQVNRVRISDTTILKIMVSVFLVGITYGYLFFHSYPMEWKEKEIVESEELIVIRGFLVHLGFPEEVLNDMTDEDVISCKNAKQIIVEVNEYPFNDGREVEEKYLDEHWITTVYDVKELKVTDVAVELSDGKTWIFLHHFLWQDEPEYFGLKGFHGTDCIQIWPVYYDGSEGWREDGEVSGRVLYDKNEVTYLSDYEYLGEKTYTSNSIFFGTQESNDVFAAFSLPKDGINKRGYVMYRTEQIEEGWIASSWFNYTHQMHLLQYPVKTAMEACMKDGWNSRSVFRTIQNAFQFYVTEDGVEMAGE